MMSMPIVAIERSSATGYSDAWMTEADFPEKRLLRALSGTLEPGSENLFRGQARPGDRVAVKPNWVLDFHPSGLDVFSVITHSAILRAVVDLLYEAMEGSGEIVIADAPQFNCDFARLLEVTQVQRIADYFRARHDFEIPIRDLRQIACVAPDLTFIRAEDRIELAGDPRGYAVVDLREQSAFSDMPHPERVYGADYDRSETVRHHNEQRHEYLVAKTFLDADLVVHVPKLKVHKKVGITVNAKGMVGINGNKNWLAHYRVGSPSAGGDEFPVSEPLTGKARAHVMRWGIDHLLVPQTRSGELAFRSARAAAGVMRPLGIALAKRYPQLGPGDLMLHGGNWYGNDTAWRMTVDLARAILYADAEGQLQTGRQRRFVSVVDGIIGGEREGPLSPTPKPCGVLLGGTDLLSVDLVAARLMGFDPLRLRYQRWLMQESPQDMGVTEPAGVVVRSNVPEWEQLMSDPGISDLAFEPHPGWRGHVELQRAGGGTV